MAGLLKRETIINLDGQVIIDQPGGNLLYTAAAFRFWSPDGYLLSHVGEDYPQDWLENIHKLGFDITGIKRLQQHIDERAFYAILEPERIDTDNPIGFFGRLGLPFPKSLLGYTNPNSSLDDRNQKTSLTIFPNDIPPGYCDISAAYLGSLDYLSMNLLPPYLRERKVKHILIKPSKGTMNPSFWYEFPELIRGCTALICTAKNALNLFQDRSEDLWEITEKMAGTSIEIVVITCGIHGQILFDRINRKRWEIPAYPVKVIDPIHASDAFAGGFLAGYCRTFDPLTAALYGNVSASIKIQGSGPFYILDTLPELAKSRLDTLRDQTIKK